jgi:hypothetical protein
MQYRQKDFVMQHGHGYASWAWARSMDMNTQHNTKNSENFVITENVYNTVRKYIEYVKKIHHKQKVQCGKKMKNTYGVSTTVPDYMTSVS